MPRFSIKDLLIATTLISVGLGLLYFVYQHRYTPDDEAWELGAYLGGGALIGAGAMTPFKRPLRGAIIAVVLMLLAGLVV
jgi:hypothetical protein